MNYIIALTKAEKHQLFIYLRSRPVTNNKQSAGQILSTVCSVIVNNSVRSAELKNTIFPDELLHADKTL